MFRRRFLCLMAVILGLTLLPVTALARDHDRDWGHNRSTYNRGYNHNYGNGYYRNGYSGYGNNGYYGYNNGYYGNGSYGCVDRDNDGDCDHIRHHHHYYQNGWNGNPYVFSNPNVYSYPNVGGNYPYAGGWRNGNRAWGNGRWGNGNVPSGWQRGKKNGWGNSSLPPGLAKKSGWW
jgi:hypothetical protein